MNVLSEEAIRLSPCKYLTKQGIRISLWIFQPRDIGLGQNGLRGYDINVSCTNMNELNRLNEIVETTNTVHFRIQSYDSVNLMLTGSLDLCYYHEVELVFHAVSYISLPADFRYPKCRKATLMEVAEIGNFIAVDTNETVFCIEAATSSSLEKLPFFVVAESVSLKEGIVFYYERENLKEGERIAPWVKVGS
jgi:hypothetical protein